jgi:hypothetical protein
VAGVFAIRLKDEMKPHFHQSRLDDGIAALKDAVEGDEGELGGVITPLGHP